MTRSRRGARHRRRSYLRPRAIKNELRRQNIETHVVVVVATAVAGDADADAAPRSPPPTPADRRFSGRGGRVGLSLAPRDEHNFIIIGTPTYLPGDKRNVYENNIRFLYREGFIIK